MPKAASRCPTAVGTENPRETLEIRRFLPRCPTSHGEGGRDLVQLTLKTVDGSGIITDTINLLSRITIDPAVCHGKPCVRGLRYPVVDLLEWLSSGMTVEDILAD